MRPGKSAAGGWQALWDGALAEAGAGTSQNDWNNSLRRAYTLLETLLVAKRVEPGDYGGIERTLIELGRSAGVALPVDIGEAIAGRHRLNHTPPREPSQHQASAWTAAMEATFHALWVPEEDGGVPSDDEILRVKAELRRGRGKRPLLGPATRYDAYREAHPVGSVVAGRVVDLQEFGAFVELSPGVQGLVHLSEISDAPTRHPVERLAQGQEIPAMLVLEYIGESRRIRLSMRRARRNEGEQAWAQGGEQFTAPPRDRPIPSAAPPVARPNVSPEAVSPGDVPIGHRAASRAWPGPVEAREVLEGGVRFEPPTRFRSRRGVLDAYRTWGIPRGEFGTRPLNVSLVAAATVGGAAGFLVGASAGYDQAIAGDPASIAVWCLLAGAAGAGAGALLAAIGTGIAAAGLFYAWVFVVGTVFGVAPGAAFGLLLGVLAAGSDGALPGLVIGAAVGAVAAGVFRFFIAEW